MKADLSELSIAALIKKLNDDPDNSSYSYELINRLDNGEYSDTDLIKILDGLLSIKDGEN